MKDAAWPGLREWLRNERRLGVRHVSFAAADVRPAAAQDLPSAAAGRPAAARRSEMDNGSPAEAAPARSAIQNAPRTAGGAGAGGTAVELPAVCGTELSPSQAAEQLRQLDEGFVRGCRRCGLHAGRTQTVFGVGRVRPDVVFVGEGPGADEDRAGEPFVGRAGQLLTRMILAMTLSREQVYICNVVKCRPPENRTPADEEMTACSPYLFRQLAILRPKVIVALGRPAAQTLLATTTPIGRLRGEFHDFPPPSHSHLGLPACKLMPTFHPAYLLRSPQEKAKTWADLQQVMGLLGLGPG